MKLRAYSTIIKPAVRHHFALGPSAQLGLHIIIALLSEPIYCLVKHVSERLVHSHFNEGVEPTTSIRRPNHKDAKPHV